MTVDLSVQLEELERRIARARKGDELPLEAAVLLEDLETAHEELRVAGDEVRTQQEEIARLLSSQRSLRLQQERMVSSLPVAVLVTNESGLITSANPAAAGLLNVGVDRLLRKPVFSFVRDVDRLPLREVLGLVRRTGVATRRSVTLLPRHRQPWSGDLFVTMTSDSDSGTQLTWLAVGSDGAMDGVVSEDPAALSEALVALTSLTGTGSLTELVPKVADTCHRALAEGMGVGIIIGDLSDPAATFATTPDTKRLVDAQLRSGSGPSVDCRSEERAVFSTEIRHDTRWPALRSRLAGTAVGSLVAAPISGGDRMVGSLLVCGRAGAELTQKLITVTELLAAAVSSILQEQGLHTELRNLTEDMERALLSRAVIDEAKGIVMADRHISADEAFEHLVALSSRLHLKLRDVARMLVEEASGNGIPPA